MNQFRLILDLQLFAEEGEAVDPGVEVAPAAEVQETEVPADQPGVETEAVAEPDKQSNFEKAFAKRLAAKEAEWEAKNAEKYKDYDTHKELSEYLQQANNLDAMSLKERIELERLQERADKENVSPETIKRIDQLEAKAAKAEEYEKLQEQQQFYQKFRTDLDKFAESKGIKADDLEQYMVEQQVNNMDIAYRAMKFEDTQGEKERIEKEAVQKYLESKKAPKAEGSGSAGYVAPSAPKTMAEARQNALEMLRAANQNA